MPGLPDTGADPGHLYDDGADLYDLLFGAEDPEEIGFFRDLLTNAPNNRILSLGCGTGRLEAAISGEGFQVTGIDASEAMLARARQRDPHGQYIAATMEAMPDALPGEPFGAIISATLSFAYIADSAVAKMVIGDCARRLETGGLFALDIPMAYAPQRLQGTIESLESKGLHYRFMWYDVIEEDELRAVLDTDIWISSDTRSAARRAQLAVYRPQGIRQLMEEMGLSEIQFHAPHDITTATSSPPPDCRRAVVIGGKRE